MFDYIISGDGCIAIPVQSDLLLFELRDYVRMKSKITQCNLCSIFNMGTIEIVNPKVQTKNDFMHGAYLIGVK